jgi:hypothetical protein
MHFTGRSQLVVLTTLAAMAVVGIQIWHGPTLEQRLWKAACAGDSQTFAWLVWLGADVGVDKHGYSPSPMQEAAYQGNLLAVRLYVLYGAYLDYLEKDGFSPTNYAAMDGSPRHPRSRLRTLKISVFAIPFD